MLHRTGGGGDVKITYLMVKVGPHAPAQSNEEAGEGPTFLHQSPDGETAEGRKPLLSFLSALPTVAA